MKNKTKEELQKEIQILKLRIKELEKNKDSDTVLLESEKKYSRILRSSPMGIHIYTLTEDGKLIFSGANPAANILLGIDNNQFIGKTIEEAFPPLADTEIPKRYREAALYGKSWKTEQIAYDDGKISGAFEVHAFQTLPGNMVAMFLEITERKQVEEALKESEELYQLLSNATFETIFISEKGICIGQNKTAENMFGYTLDEAIGRPGTDWIVPDNRDTVVKNMMSGYVKPYIVNALRKDGTSFPCEIQGRMMDFRGKQIRITALRDITERKLASDALRESENQLRALFNAMTDIVFEIDYDGRYINIAPTSPDLMFKPQEEAIGKTLHEIFPKAEADLFLKFIQECLDKNKSQTIEYPLTIKDKTYWFEGKASPKTSDSVLFIARDITERKHNEEELIKMNLAINNSSEVIFLTDKMGIITFITPEFTKLYGYTKEEVIGKLTPRILKSGLFNHSNYEQFWNTLLNKQSIPATEYVNKSKDGTLIDIEGSADPVIDKNGDIKGFLAIQRDNRKRKRTENIQKVLYNISNAAYTSDDIKKLIKLIKEELGNIIDTTNFFVALYDKNTDTLSLPFISDEKDQFTSVPAGKTLTSYVIKTQKSLLANSKTLSRLEKSGAIEMIGSKSEIWLGIPLKVEGNVIGVLAVQSYTDKNAYNESDMEMLEFVSEQISISIARKQTEQNLKKALEKANESERLKTAFLANMSHEIRTPMNGILGFADLLKAPELTDEEIQYYLSVIEKSGVRMLNIINDLIDISKVEAGQMKVNISEVKINKQTEYLYTFFKPEVENKGMKLLLNNSISSDDFIIRTDKEKLYSILTNLLKNAIKFTHNGSIEFGYNIKSVNLTKKTTTNVKNNGSEKPFKVEFYVKDSGIGIPKNRQQAIFDRFIQADIEDREAYEGSGLGLSISKAYVEMLGGKIWAESKVGKGSTFYFTIPDIWEKTSSININNKITEKETLLADKELKILIAEDDEFAKKHLSIILNKMASEIIYAKTGKEAVKLCKNNSDIDLILMDIKMPEMDGFESTRQIRKFNTDVKIIAQTAYALEGDKDKALEAGCDDYISKPINKGELLEKIEKLIKSH